jgi:glycylpeptide N-tetradecanoyltransferase
MAEPQESKGKAPAQDHYDSPDVPTTDNSAENPSEGTEGSSAKKDKKPLTSGLKEKLTKLRSSDGKNVTPKMLEQLLSMNPSLAGELANMPQDQAIDALTSMNVADLLTGMSLGNKNQKDMASYKFWQTQPVPRFDDQANLTEGPIKIIDPAEVSKEPPQLIEGFEWVTLDISNDTEVTELYELLSNHYVEDDNAMFRFNYSRAFLNW